jgi:hypothetical protein
MACNNCTTTKTLSGCAGVLTLGTIASLNTAVYIFVKSPSGYIYRQSTTSSVSGVVTLNLALPDTSFYHSNGSFEVWVTLASADIETRLSVTISATAYTCFNLSFQRTFDVDGDPNVVTTQTLAIE